MNFSLFGIKVQIKKEFLVVGAAILVIAIMLIGYNLIKKDRGIIIDANANSSGGVNVQVGADDKDDKDDGNADEEPDEIKVYVTGCVKKPGVVTLRRGQILEDAIIAAGGATDEADIENINLAYILNYNMMIKIRSIHEKVELEGSNAAGMGVLLVKNSGGAVVAEPTDSKKININSASIAELDTLPGIGEATAEAIVKYREQNGVFKKIEDIMNIPGIKEAKFESIKDFITVN
ncbi:MAG: helix-hairpin-helix domain-containing protein [Eubacteriales bacterium]|nr:helix-hairpin-helix domain-containing protein [Eubacteriales bacterium]